MAKTDEILRDALTLSPDDRAHLAEELLASLDDVDTAEVQNAWAAEIDRREAEALAGTSEHEDWRVAFATIDRKVRR